MFYEALIFLSWSFTIIHLIIETQFPWTGTILAPTALFLNAFASFQLPESLQKHNSLIPALQSNWLMMHVTVMLLSYATLITGCVLAIALLALIGTGSERTPSAPRRPIVASQAQRALRARGRARSGASAPFGAKASTMAALPLTISRPLPEAPSADETKPKVHSAREARAPLLGERPLVHSQDLFLFEIEGLKNSDKRANQLDQLSFRSIGIGFPLLTVGILSGSVWANEAWGSYWSWDPKETWSFITWIIFAIYLHLRLNKKWSGVKSAILATIGFFVVWICFLGVNFLAKGLHSYGWFI